MILRIAFALCSALASISAAHGRTAAMAEIPPLACLAETSDGGYDVRIVDIGNGEDLVALLPTHDALTVVYRRDYAIVSKIIPSSDPNLGATIEWYLLEPEQFELQVAGADEWTFDDKSMGRRHFICGKNLDVWACPARTVSN